MEQKFIDRINALARKSKTEGLTPAEAEEQKALRAQYLAMWKRSLENELDHTYIMDEQGNKHKLRKKED